MHREVETHPSKPSLCPPLFTKQRLLHQPTAKLGVHSQGALPKTGSTWPCEASTTDAKTGRSACSRVCSQSRQGLCKPFWLVKSLNTVMRLVIRGQHLSTTLEWFWQGTLHGGVLKVKNELDRFISPPMHFSLEAGGGETFNTMGKRPISGKA